MRSNLEFDAFTRLLARSCGFDRRGGFDWLAHGFVGCVTVGDGRMVDEVDMDGLELFTTALGLGEPWRVTGAEFAE